MFPWDGGRHRAQVTLAVVLGGCGKITKALAAKYVLAQLAAAALAGLVPWLWWAWGE